MKRQQGFGLIEVLIAFIMVSVTAGSLLQLNKSYLEYSRDGRSREVALRLAESKLDEIRYFKDKQGYQNIASGSESTALDGVTYELDWTVDDYGWDAANTKWATPPPSGVASGKKEIALTIGWEDAGGSDSFTLASVVSPNLSIDGGPFGSSGANTGLGQGGPKVGHTPGAIPDIISMVIDPDTGIKQETTKPAPEISKQGNDVVVSFDAVTYDAGSDSLIKSDSRTLYCSCDTQSGTKSTRKPAAPIALSQGIYWENGGLTDKGWGTSSNANCTSCCNNHYDVPASSLFADNYNQFNKGHSHTGSTYFESCRMLRIDGYYQVMPDWNLVSLNVFPPGYLTNVGNVTLYQGYIKQVVQAYVSELKAGTQTVDYKATPYRDWLSANGTTEQLTSFDDLTDLFVSSSYQFAARAIYVDILPPDLLDKVDFTQDNWLSGVSFNEVNVTLLADWEVSAVDDLYLDVTNEDINTIVDPDSNYFGTYSRGYVTGELITPLDKPSVTAKMTRYNSGLTGQSAISTFDGSNEFSSSLDVEVNTGSLADVTFDGVIQCLTSKSSNPTVAISCSKNDFGKTTVTATNGTCTLNKEADVATASYQCTVPALQLTTTVTFSENANNSDFVFNAGGTNPKVISLTAGEIAGGTIPCVLQISKNITNYSAMTCTP
ncbi:prepilin-type N-terminal cleavage/methylation domain-containing protein [Oceanisphaera sp. KMM 10153]|uniref:prepilin-type N-terminal cleavage/methylation domain-containing protein n=1 Tax=Oceanisphaera submarina TaxID=3390193 RepID=UPI003976D6AE